MGDWRRRGTVVGVSDGEGPARFGGVGGGA